ncbi:MULTISPECIES: sulfite exporter TauE/SafE family protein [Sphingobacterium]|uniref:sulfite exporter TauE/SafE family protein n=1 Tax=Sphingobacterium TaxID=28453 RepID=UPI0013DAC857|nr:MULTISPECIES: sulfite exporter TauE/SafE family protein [unclassified Sphingobacterium]
MEIFGSLLAVVIGITLGMMGSGGSILTVPVLVYILHVDPNLSTTYSLFAIGVSSFIGSVINFTKGTIEFRKVLDFGLPSIITVFLTRQFILPLVPKVFNIGPWSIHQNTVLMIFFACIMILSAFSMINRKIEQNWKIEKKYSKGTTIGQGIGVGFITGVVGAGGGFLIIPALINFYKMPMTRAVSTSLAIIAINSLFGLVGDLEKFTVFDWNLVLQYTSALILGMLIGFYLLRFFTGNQLKKILGFLIFFVGIFIIINEFLLKN